MYMYITHKHVLYIHVSTRAETNSALFEYSFVIGTIRIDIYYSNYSFINNY